MKKKGFIIASIVILILVIILMINFNKKDVVTEDDSIINNNSTGFRVELIGKDSCKNGDEIEFIVELKDVALVGGSANGIMALIATLEYDETKLEKIDGEGKNGFGFTWGNNLVIDNSTGVNTDTEIAVLRFKVKEDAESEKTVISLKNITGSNGDKDIEAIDFSKALEIAE